MELKRDLVKELLKDNINLTNAEIAKKYINLTKEDRNPETVRKAVSRLRIKLGGGKPKNQHNTPKITSKDSKEVLQWDENTANNTANIKIEVSDTTIKNLEEALTYSKVDLGEWEIERHIFNSWTTSAIDRNTGEWKQINNIQVKVWFKKRVGAEDGSTEEELRAAFINELASYAPDYSKTKFDYKGGKDRKCLLEVSVPDLHVGKMSWGEESGENYKTKEAIKRYNLAIEALLERTNLNLVEKILLPVGNDMINIDTLNSTTTAGTPQSADSRWQQMFRKAKELLIYNIDRLSKLAPVEVLIVPGNHDFQTMNYMGEVLSAWYRSSRNVKINHTASQRKYIEYGTNLIGFTHGNNEKHLDLGLLMAEEVKEAWARTSYREFHLGHFHKSKSIHYISNDEFQGFKVRVLPSLSGSDQWHSAKGYQSMKAAEGYLYHKEDGLINIIRYNHLSK